MANYKICTSDHKPDEPGGGGPDSTLSQDQLPSDINVGSSLSEARDRLSEMYRYTDWSHWIERENFRVITLSGPSCAGKGPLKRTIDKYFNNLEYTTVPVIKSKESRPKGPRPDEIEIWDNPRYFRNKSEIQGLGKKYEAGEGYCVGDCRGLPQAVSMDEIIRAEQDIVFIEAYHTMAHAINDYKENMGYPALTRVFLSPISNADINLMKEEGKNVQNEIESRMFEKLSFRSVFQGEDPNDPVVVEDNKKRAKTAYSEIQKAYLCSHVIPNPAAEGSPEWNMDKNGIFYDRPVGEAWKTSRSLAELMTCGKSDRAEMWFTNTL